MAICDLVSYTARSDPKRPKKQNYKTVAQDYNPNYLGSRNWKDRGSRPLWAKKFKTPSQLLKNQA
jgi:hypothetical protein